MGDPTSAIGSLILGRRAASSLGTSRASRLPTFQSSCSHVVPIKFARLTKSFEIYDISILKLLGDRRSMYENGTRKLLGAH
jgi:hypothetical protein